MRKEINISLGENCLTDNVLERFGIKSFSTPYSHGRSNIDYAIHLEKEKYSRLLNHSFLYYDHVGPTKVIRNFCYSKADKIFSDIHLKGFEFTHHDVINNGQHRQSYERKIQRMLSIDNNFFVRFYYHYRKCNKQNLERFIPKAKEFLSFYKSRGTDCQLIFFTQETVATREKKSVEKIYDKDRIKGYVFRTLKIWGGKDQDTFWAKEDDDLISVMIKENS